MMEPPSVTVVNSVEVHLPTSDLIASMHANAALHGPLSARPQLHGAFCHLDLP